MNTRNELQNPMEELSRIPDQVMKGSLEDGAMTLIPSEKQKVRRTEKKSEYG